ncbi:unnamed protein product, partial [Clonostachys solani]
IFKVFWSEPRGKCIPSISGCEKTISDLEHFFLTGFKRFIVFSNGERQCTAIPILTYESMACTKKGVQARSHGVIHDDRKRPRLLKSEPTLGYRPVRAVMSETSETLSTESRLNYSKHTIIEYNALTYFIGFIHPDDWKIFKRAVSHCVKQQSRYYK